MQNSPEVRDSSTSFSSIIKVVGVGGGGSNAVNYMFNQGIKDVDFVVINTDIQALDSSPVPNKIQIGTELTEGLGAGANPDVGRDAALESKEEIKKFLSGGTKMVFITAGMGGGTGTGAAPVVAEIAQSLGILTVGIVTRPFTFEGRPKAKRAEEGLRALEANCDTVITILNNRLKEVFGKAKMREAFSQADNVLTTAARSIAEIITVSGWVNVDFEDVKTVMKNAGSAVMGSAVAEGEDRAIRAAEGAITSPLLNDTEITGSKYILLSIVVGNEDTFEMEELDTITDFIYDRAGESVELIFGTAIDESLGEAISVTVIATGFSEDSEDEIQAETIDLETNRPVERETIAEVTNTLSAQPSTESKIVVEPDFFEKPEPVESLDIFDMDNQPNEEEEEEHDPRLKYYRSNAEKGHSSRYNLIKSVVDMNSRELQEKQETPAYIRKGLNLKKEEEHQIAASGETRSRFELNESRTLNENNRFFHDVVD